MSAQSKPITNGSVLGLNITCFEQPGQAILIVRKLFNKANVQL